MAQAMPGNPGMGMRAEAAGPTCAVVSFMAPVAMLQMTTRPEIARIAYDVRARLESVKAALAGRARGDSKG